MLTGHLLSIAPVDTAKHPIPESLHIGLSAVIGAGWLGAYIMAIRRGFRDRLTAIPLAAVAFNVAWEFCYAFVFYTPPVGRLLNTCWFLLDLVIVGQVFAYGHKDRPSVGRRTFLVTMAALLVFAFAFMLTANHEFADADGGYTAFGLNAFLSYSFIAMLERRGSTVGQTMYIAIFKMVGSIAACAMFARWYPDRPLLYLFYLAIVVLDGTYVVLLHRRFRSEGIPAWRTV
jgi:hypothetical protein